MNFKLLLKSCCITGCLFLILIPLLIYYYWQSNKDSNPLGSVQPTQSELKVSEPKLRVILVSDIESDFDNLKLFVEEANKLAPDMVIALGDLTSLGVKNDFIEFKSITSLLNSPIYYLPGDRDLWKSSGVSNYQSVLGLNYQLFDKNGLKFLLIDNSNEYEGIDSVQLDFINKNIEQVDYVLLHNPIYFNKSILGAIGKGMGQYSSEVDVQREELLALVRKHSVSAVFAGDQHYFSVTEDEVKSSLEHIVIGSLSSKRNLDAPNFGYLKIYEDKSFEVEKYYLK